MTSDLKIAIVEDEPLIADHIEQYVLDAGFNSAGIADNFTDAKELLQKENPDLILLDINLGDGPDGIDIAHYINQHHKKPFIFISSNTDAKTLERVKLTNPFGDHNNTSIDKLPPSRTASQEAQKNSIKRFSWKGVVLSVATRLTAVPVTKAKCN